MHYSSNMSQLRNNHSRGRLDTLERSRKYGNKTSLPNRLEAFKKARSLECAVEAAEFIGDFGGAEASFLGARALLETATLCKPDTDLQYRLFGRSTELARDALVLSKAIRLLNIELSAEDLLSQLPVYVKIFGKQQMPNAEHAQKTYQKTIKILNSFFGSPQPQSSLVKRQQIGWLSEAVVRCMLNRHAIKDVGAEDFIATSSQLREDRGLRSVGQNSNSSWDITAFCNKSTSPTPVYFIQVKSTALTPEDNRAKKIPYHDGISMLYVAEDLALPGEKSKLAGQLVDKTNVVRIAKELVEESQCQEPFSSSKLNQRTELLLDKIDPPS